MSYTRIFLTVLVCSSVLASCKINQRKNGMKEGRWVYKDTVLDVIAVSKGRYRNGFEVGTWKDFLGKNLNTKRKYQDSICYTTEYHKNGKIRAIGISKMIVDSTTIHWFLSGEWKFYDSEGVWLGTKLYEKGEPILETHVE